MGSLFSKIFFSFWLAGLLVGGTLFALEDHFRGDEMQRAQQRLAAHAETVSALLGDSDPAALGAWLTGLQRHEHHRIWLMDAEGRPPFGIAAPQRLLRHLRDAPLHAGAIEITPDLYANVVTIPGKEPPLYLVALTHIERLHMLSPLTRLLVAAFITGLVSFGLARILTRQIRRVRGAAQALAAGDLSVRIGYGGHDEVAALARDFDIMAARLRELLDSQRRLLSDVSHELRSPLARLKVALELARKKGDTQTALTRIERESDRLETLLGEVLSLARLESGQMALRHDRLELNDLLQDIVQDADFEANANGRSVALHAGETISIDGDVRLIGAAVENVVRNAVRHTAEGSAVEVTLEREGTNARITVRDHGNGVPEEQLERIFIPFARVDEARDRASGGYGLGLAISRRAMMAHGGSVGAENAPDGGLRIILRLPAAPAEN